VTRVYVDVEATAIGGSGESSLDEAALRSLRFLSEAGHEVILVAPPGLTLPRELLAAAAEVVAAVPAKPIADAWYLTTEVDRCQGTSARLRTVLIGAPPPAGSIHRCDGVARDVQAAALELMASEAMPPAATPPA
jgi:hypothetical protein